MLFEYKKGFVLEDLPGEAVGMLVKCAYFCEYKYYFFVLIKINK